GLDAIFDETELVEEGSLLRGDRRVGEPHVAGVRRARALVRVRIAGDARRAAIAHAAAATEDLPDLAGLASDRLTGANEDVVRAAGAAALADLHADVRARTVLDGALVGRRAQAGAARANERGAARGGASRLGARREAALRVGGADRHAAVRAA